MFSVDVYCCHPFLFVGIVQGLYIQYEAKFVVTGISHSYVSNQGKYIFIMAAIKKSCSPVSVNNFCIYRLVKHYTLCKKSWYTFSNWVTRRGNSLAV